MLFKGKAVLSTLAFDVNFSNGDLLPKAEKPWVVGDELPPQIDGVVHLVNARVAGDNLDRLDFVQFDPRHPGITRDDGGRVTAQGGMCHASDLLPKE